MYGFGASLLVLRGKFIDCAPYDLYAACILSAICMQPEPNTEIHVFVLRERGSGGGGGGVRNVKIPLLVKYRYLRTTP